jgi:hypothetical protein
VIKQATKLAERGCRVGGVGNYKKRCDKDVDGQWQEKTCHIFSCFLINYVIYFCVRIIRGGTTSGNKYQQRKFIYLHLIVKKVYISSSHCKENSYILISLWKKFIYLYLIVKKVHISSSHCEEISYIFISLWRKIIYLHLIVKKNYI